MSRFSNRLASAALAALLVTGCAPVGDGGRALSIAGNPHALPVKSMLERRYLTVVRQRYDFSCGSAALATLLHFHYDDPQTEQTVFLGMWRDGDQAQIRRLGFSLLDMKRFLASQGLKADGYEVSLADIARTKVPGIALVNMGGYRHFVVVKGVENGQVLVGDPSLGIRLIRAAEFRRMWNGVLFVINDRVDHGKQSFGREQEWALVARARATLLMEPVSLQALQLIRPQFFPLEL